MLSSGKETNENGGDDEKDEAQNKQEGCQNVYRLVEAFVETSPERAFGSVC
jgi:hypothetical protein